MQPVRSWVRSPALSALSWCVALCGVVGGLVGTPRAQEPAAEVGIQAVVVPIQDQISVVTVRLVRRGIEAARELGAARVVFDIDTPGGPVVVMREIEMLLATLREQRGPDGIQTVAWVRRHALSAGGFIALACDQTWMAPGATIGAITPVMVGPGGIEQIPEDDARRKTLSAFRGDVRALVQERGTPSASTLHVAEAMVDPRMRPVEVTYVDETGGEKTEVMEADELAAMSARGVEILRQEDLGPTPLTLTAQQAVRFGLARGARESLGELLNDEFGYREEAVRRLDETWSESAVAWLEGVKPLLFLFGFLLLLLELKAPGTFLPGTLGVLLIAIGLFSSYLLGLAEWTEILLFFLGLGLLGVELFVIPGTFLPGLLGFLAVLASLILSQQTFILPDGSRQEDILADNLLNLLYLVLLTMVSAAGLYRLLPHVPFLNRALLNPPDAESMTGASTRFVGAQAELSRRLLGVVGIAASDLRPSGILELADGSRHDVVSSGGFVGVGARIRVVDVQGNRVVVEEDREDAGGPEAGAVSIGLLILLVVIGLGMVIAEVFFVSGGLLGIGAAVALVTAIFLAFTHQGPAIGMVFLGVAAVGTPLALAFALRLLPRTALGRRLLLMEPDPEVVHGAAQEQRLAELAGAVGVTECWLRPAGYARIRGRRVDVVSRGEPIESGVRIRVVQVDGNRVVVAPDREIPASSDESTSSDATSS